MSGTVWYSISLTSDLTQPTPTGFTWTQLGSVSAFTECSGYTYFGDVQLGYFEYLYIQVRDELTTTLYYAGFGAGNTCVSPTSNGFTNNLVKSSVVGIGTMEFVGFGS